MNRISLLFALVFSSAAAAAPLKSRDEISAPPAANETSCYGKPTVSDVQKAGYKLALVRSAVRWKDDGVCTKRPDGEHLAVYEEIDGGYRTLKSAEFADATVHPILVTALLASDSGQSPEALLVIERHLSGTAQSIDYELYRLSRSGDLQPVKIKSPARLLQVRLRDGQDIGEPGYDFADDHISFGMEIRNEGDHYRHPSGGSAFGTMKLVAAEEGLELVPEPKSLQLSSESDRLNRLGLAAYQQKRYVDAAEYYRQAIHWNRRNHEAKSNLGLVYFRLNKIAAAIEVCNEVLQTSDASVSIRAACAYNLGRAYESLGEQDRAAQFYSTAQRLEPAQARHAALERVRGQSDTSQVKVRPVNELPGFKLFSPREAMRAANINDFAPDDHEHGLWLATQRGLLWVDRDFQIMRAPLDVPPSEFGNSLSRVVLGPLRAVAIVERRDEPNPGTTTGIAIVDKSWQWQQFIEVPGISAIQYHSGWGMWFTTTDTVGWIDERTNRRTSFPVGEGKPRQLAADGQEAWFSMASGQGGVIHVDRSRDPPLIEHFDTAQGLRHSNAQALAVDDIRVWVSHGGFGEALGLSVIDRRTRDVKVLSKTSNGIPVGGLELLREGEFLWSAQDGNLMRMNIFDESGQMYECASVVKDCRISRMVETRTYVWLLLSPTAIARFYRH